MHGATSESAQAGTPAHRIKPCRIACAHHDNRSKRLTVRKNYSHGIDIGFSSTRQLAMQLCSRPSMRRQQYSSRMCSSELTASLSNQSFFGRISAMQSARNCRRILLRQNLSATVDTRGEDGVGTFTYSTIKTFTSRRVCGRQSSHSQPTLMWTIEQSRTLFTRFDASEGASIAFEYETTPIFLGSSGNEGIRECHAFDNYNQRNCQEPTSGEELGRAKFPRIVRRRRANSGLAANLPGCRFAHPGYQSYPPLALRFAPVVRTTFCVSA